jgi:predicted P-loop ATPase
MQAVDYTNLSLRPIRVYGVTKGICHCIRGAACTSTGKHPVNVGWPNGAPESFDKHSGNIGLAVGPDHVVVDVDGEDGRASLAAFDIPLTWTSRSGHVRGGGHIWFKIGPGQKVKNAQKPLPGIDVRAKGGMVVAPPSIHASGRAYEWINAPGSCECAVLPDALYAALFPVRDIPAPEPRSTERIPASQRKEACRRYVAAIPPAISGNGGHTQAYCVARVIVQDFEQTGADAWELFKEYNQRCEPPFSDKDLEHKINDASKARVQRLKGIERFRRTRPTDSSCGSGEPSDWRSELQHKLGLQVMQPIEHNLVLILTNCDRFRGRIRKNEFTGDIELHDIDLGERLGGVRSGALEDNDLARVMAWFQQAPWSEGGSGKFTDRTVLNAINIVAHRNAYHPVRDWLLSLHWDKRLRISDWTADFCSAARTVYNGKVARKFLIASVARALDPGCQVDTTLILEGGQGVGKSTLIRKLFGDDWTQASRIDIGDKDGAIALRGKWAVEFAELESFRGRDARSLKAFLTLTRDSYRPPYGRGTVTFPRQCVFIGTTNDEQYLVDDTGNRRFWPVTVGEIDTQGIEQYRDQLWAEAVDAYLQGETHWLEGNDIKEAATEQEQRRIEDPWEPIVAAGLGDRPVTTHHVLGIILGVETAKQTRGDQMRVGAILKTLGLKRVRVTRGTVQTWEYKR